MKYVVFVFVMLDFLYYHYLIFWLCDDLLKFFCVSDCTASADDSGCCTSKFQCYEGEGDCDSDSECAGDLLCGKDNCVNFNSAWPDSAFDCCTQGKNIIKYRLGL